MDDDDESLDDPTYRMGLPPRQRGELPELDISSDSQVLPRHLSPPAAYNRSGGRAIDPTNRHIHTHAWPSAARELQAGDVDRRTFTDAYDEG